MNAYFCSSCRAQQPQRQRFAFTAVLVSNSDMEMRKYPTTPPPHTAGWIIGRAAEGERGYTIIPREGISVDEKKARERAVELNKEAGWTDEGEAAMIVLRTMPMKEDHLTGLLDRAVTFLKVIGADRTDSFLLNHYLEEAEELIEDCKGYLKEEA